jgi:UrcA family protein
MKRCLAIPCALLFASLPVSSACPAEPVARTSRLVPYDDLDLSTVRGIKTLQRRVERALLQICLDPSGSASPAGTLDTDCMSEGWRDARVQMTAASARQQADNLAAAARASVRITEAAPRPSSKH